MEDFVTFELAKKLKEKGFNCTNPFAMYNELAQFCILVTSADYHVCDSGYKYRNYYDYDDFDEYDYVAPTISQVLKWLREEKKLHIEIYTIGKRPIKWCHTITELKHSGEAKGWTSGLNGKTYEEATLAGIEYVLDNLI